MVADVKTCPIDVMGRRGAGKGFVCVVEKGGRVGEVAAG